MIFKSQPFKSRGLDDKQIFDGVRLIKVQSEIEYAEIYIELE